MNNHAWKVFVAFAVVFGIVSSGFWGSLILWGVTIAITFVGNRITEGRNNDW